VRSDGRRASSRGSRIFSFKTRRRARRPIGDVVMTAFTVSEGQEVGLTCVGLAVRQSERRFYLILREAMAEMQELWCVV
jgi:hypothetical protein